MRTESRGQAFKRAIEQRGGIEWIAAAVEQGRSMRWIRMILGAGGGGSTAGCTPPRTAESPYCGRARARGEG